MVLLQTPHTEMVASSPPATGLTVEGQHVLGLELGVALGGIALSQRPWAALC